MVFMFLNEVSFSVPRSARPVEIPLLISTNSPASIPAQLAEQLRSHILQGVLAPGDFLPSSRSLAQRLGVARGSVVAAFEQLSAEGYVESSKAGTRVLKNLELQKISTTPRQSSHFVDAEPRLSGPTSPAAGGLTGGALAGVRFNLNPGAPDTSLLTSAAWRSAWRRAAAEPGVSFPAAGSEVLRRELAEHLRIMRHVVRAPEQVLVTSGARDGFRLVLSALRAQMVGRGVRRPLRVAVENPGYPSLYRIPAAFGHEILPVDVDGQGLVPAALPVGEGRPDVVLVAPSHQYPLGASMPLARRVELLAWAQQNSAFIVEDDYDSELRYTGEPLPALAALDAPGELARVITLGSFAKTLAPGLGAGFLLAPDPLLEDLKGLRADLGSPVSALVQVALADFLASGGARRHISRMRRVYGQRRESLLEGLEGLPSSVEVVPMDGGLHVVLRFLGSAASAEVEREVADVAAQRGLALGCLGDYWAHSSGSQRGRDCGLILGFGAENERVLGQGLVVLRQVLGQVL